MMRYILFLSLLFPLNAWAQFSASKLPIIKIQTESSLEIIDEPKRRATISIVHNEEGAFNFLSSTDYVFTSDIGIEIRGESSQALFPKKSFLFETWDEEGNDKDTSFLNFPSEEDFILYAPFADKTLLNNALAMKLGREMGQYASRTRFVELVVNDEYLGVYVIMEKIKRDNDRVDIAKLRTEDIEGDELSGGYIIRIDKGNHEGWESKFNALDGPNPIFFQYYYPSAEDIQAEQKIYIQSYVDEFEEAVASPDGINSQGKHYGDYINLRSFIDNFILNEFSKNIDAFRLSTYFHKDKDSNGGRMIAGPLWDYNLSFGNADFCEGDRIEGWIYYQCPGASPFWWDRMLNDDYFINGLKCRWDELRSSILSNESIMTWIDEESSKLELPAQRNFNRWQILGFYVWPNPNYFVLPETYDEVITAMKFVIENRLNWLDANMPGLASDCSFYDNLEEGITSVNDNKVDPVSINVFPNPGIDRFNISSTKIVDYINMYDVLGNLVERRKVGHSQYQFLVKNNLAPGTYILTLELEENTFRKIVVIQ